MTDLEWIERIKKLSIIEQETGCWIWMGRRDRFGYARTNARLNEKKFFLVHRVCYVIYRGNIGTGLTLDHLCRRTSCINHDHLEAVTSKENTLRGESFSAVRARATHCIHGHPLSGPNLYIRPDGLRDCRTCIRARSSAYQARKRNAA